MNYLFDKEFDPDVVRKHCNGIRKMRKPAHQLDACRTLGKQLRLSTDGEVLGTGLPPAKAEEGLQVFHEFANLYAELHDHSRAEIHGIAAIVYSLPASQIEVARWRALKAKYTAAPYRFLINPSYLVGGRGVVLDDDLKATAPLEPYMDKPRYVLEPYWSDIVKVLETQEVCNLYRRGGVSREGQPPRYFFVHQPAITLLGTNDTKDGPLYDLRPCRSLMCPGAHLEKVKRCSRCGQAAYCSRTCQKEHWPLHKPLCKAINETQPKA